ncbi:MAG: class A beta-lactamase-related serine hydrolase, partial [Gammaproteobacteria bacterium]|nr:class A beta-lactamase-related serine hydrolase [Gammaproteobacteria bacterium]
RRARAESVGMSTERLEAMGRFFEQETRRDAAAGYTILVARHGKLVYSAAVGMRDREAKVPMSLDTRFRMFSMTKPVTSVAVLMLYEEGKLQLDDPVSRYLPAFAQSQVFAGVDAAGKPLTEPARQPITIRQLLTHTSGLGYGPGYDASSPIAGVWGSFNLFGPGTPDDKIRQLAGLPLYFQPGSQWRYSYATDVLGRLVEVVSGLPFADFLKQRLFDPLGMIHTGFHVPAADAGLVAVAYQRDADGKLQRVGGPLAAPPTAPPPFVSGGAGLISTAGDYLRFAQMLADKGRFGGRQYLSPATVELMTSSHVPDDSMGKAYGDKWRGLGFGLGVSPVIDYRHVPQANRNGDYTWPGVLDTNWMVSPSTGVVAVVLAQVVRGADRQPNRTYQDMHNQVYQAVTDLDR